MTKETIKKLVLSGNQEDRDIAMMLLKGKSKEEIREFFGLIHNNSHTIIKALHSKHERPLPPRMSYKISEDCIIYFGYNVSIICSPYYKNHVDLTIENQ